MVPKAIRDAMDERETELLVLQHSTWARCFGEGYGKATTGEWRLETKSATCRLEMTGGRHGWYGRGLSQSHN